MFISGNAAAVAQNQAIIDGVLDGAGPTHSTVKLAQGPFAPTPTSDPATFTEADYTGYASKTVAVWEPAYLVVGGASETIPSTVLHYAPTGTAVGNVIAGYWMEAADGTYLGGEAFDTPIPLTGPTTVINLLPKWQVPPASWSAALIP